MSWLHAQQSAGTQGPQHSSTIEATKPAVHSGGRPGQVTLPVHGVSPPSQLDAGSVGAQCPAQSAPTLGTHASDWISRQSSPWLQPLPSLLLQGSGVVSPSPAEPPEPPTVAVEPPEPPTLEDPVTDPVGPPTELLVPPTEPLAPPTEPAELLVPPTEPLLLPTTLPPPAPPTLDAASFEFFSDRPAQAETITPTSTAAQRTHDTIEGCHCSRPRAKRSLPYPSARTSAPQRVRAAR